MDKCAFMSKFGCRILKNSICQGTGKCRFYKTPRQLVEDENRRIELCRERGLCSNVCPYRDRKHNACEYKEVPND